LQDRLLELALRSSAGLEKLALDLALSLEGMQLVALAEPIAA
jgi:hypothetical protein